jgi:hypothetical protein
MVSRDIVQKILDISTQDKKLYNELLEYDSRIEDLIIDTGLDVATQKDMLSSLISLVEKYSISEEQKEIAIRSAITNGSNKILRYANEMNWFDNICDQRIIGNTITNSASWLETDVLMMLIEKFKGSINLDKIIKTLARDHKID